jgi:hypothetical protein
MKTITLFFALMILGQETVRAADASLIDGKNQSAFTMEPNERNPFWPIGWKPATKTGPETAGPEIPPTAFLVSSITLGETERFAIINGKVMKEGQQFGLQMGSQTYQITLKEIQDGQVVLLRRDEEIIVPLRRK